MKTKSNKSTLILIIILLIIFLPLSIYGTYLHILDNNSITVNCDINVNNLCYTCKVKGCTGALNTVLDSNYSLNFYKEGIGTYTRASSRYVFITDDNKTIMYDGGENPFELGAINDYNIGLNNNLYIVRDASSGKWGVCNIDTMFNVRISYKYDFIGVANKIVDGKLDSSKFVVLLNNAWKIIDDNDTDLSTYFDEPIYDYNDNFVVTYQSGYNVYSYDGILIGFPGYDNVYFFDSYIGVKSGFDFAIYDKNGLQIGENHIVNTNSDITYEKENGVMVVFIDNVPVEYLY